MAQRPKFTLSFSPPAIEHLDRIEPKHHRLLRRTIKGQLTYTPTEETRNRQPLDQPAPFEASWELRCGSDHRFRIFYDVDSAVAVLLVPNDDEDLERLMLGRSPRFQALLHRSRQSLQEGKGLSEEAFWQAVRKRARERKAKVAEGRRTKGSS